MLKDSEIHITVEKQLVHLLEKKFPSLASEDNKCIAEQLHGFSDDELETILSPGKWILDKGNRVLLSYLAVSPQIYTLTGRERFRKWTFIANKVSNLSISCCEGFFDSSVPILRKGGIELLENWTNMEISLAKKNKWLAVAFCKFTGELVASTESDRFSELVAIGKEFSDSNIKVAEAYFENLPYMLSHLSNEDFILFCDMLTGVSKKHWITAVDIINTSREVLPLISPERRKKLIQSLIDFQTKNESLRSALFRNSPQVIIKLNDEEFDHWINVAEYIAKVGGDAAVAYFNRSHDLLDTFEITELREWAERGADKLFHDKQSFRFFIHGSLKGLANTSLSLTKTERLYLIDEGIKLAAVNFECVESYFENCVVTYRLLNSHLFCKWVDIGTIIAKENSDLASAYYTNSALSLEKVRHGNHADIFKTAGMLLEKDWSLTAAFFENLPAALENIEIGDIRKWAGIGIKVYDQNKELALEYFSHSPLLLDELNTSELEKWALYGIELIQENPASGKTYFTLTSRGSKDYAEELTGSVALKNITTVLRYYALGLSGVNFRIRSRNVLQIKDEQDTINPIVAGNTIYLTPKLSIFGDFEDNFRIYKLSMMHEVGHVKFSSMEVPLRDVSKLLAGINKEYENESERYGKFISKMDAEDPVDISDIISMFPNQIIAASILGVLEDARIEFLIMDMYRGVRQDLESIRQQMLMEREKPDGNIEEFMDALLWISTGKYPDHDLSNGTKTLLKMAGSLLEKYVLVSDSTILNSLEAAFEIYTMLDSEYGPLGELEYQLLRNIEYRGVGIGAYAQNEALFTKSYDNIIKNFIPDTETDLTSEEERPQEGEEKESRSSMDKNRKIIGSYKYDEWDATIGDYKSDWCTVNEIETIGGSADYYADAMERYSNEIALIKSVFGRMRPEAFHKLKKQTDGTEIDIDAFIDAIIERRCGINPDENLYIRWDKQERDVATLFLIDVSASTQKVLDQTGRSILDVEKDALIIMLQALESIGDSYAAYAFSGHSREDVEYFILKDFDEELSDNVSRRLSLLEPASNTRLGPAIRHSIRKLEQVSAKTKIIILLSDGEPYDSARGEENYQGFMAEEDTKISIQEGHEQNINFFCITVDTEPGEYLDNIFSDIGYTIIDDAQMLPELLPLLYKRITT
ncbi:VWA domain-containing protein [Methanolobus sp. ZRKC3]|uniref:nitric oxide reductase activation protein NorD n=1 Tax=Methanolobus sp. ZRKC3 TaxID=3125786 RepID=UPI0032484315